MNVHAFVSTYLYQPTQILVGTHFYRASDDNLQIALYLIISSLGIHTAEEKKAAAKAAVEAYAAAQGWVLNNIGFDHPQEFVEGAFIADASADATTSLPTNHNAVSILLNLHEKINTISVAHNDLATKYNDLAIKYNELKATLEANGLLATA